MSALLVDGTNLAFRSSVVGQLHAAGSPTGVAFSFLRSLRKVIEDLQPSLVLIAWDGGRSPWRTSLYPGYKDRTRRKSQFADEQFRQQLYRQIDALREELLPLLPVVQWRLPQVEADDLICAACLMCSGVGCQSVTIFSNDQDFYQLLDVASILTPDGLYTEEDFRRDYGIEPAQWAKYRALAGDSSDGIPGVPGIGPVKAKALLTNSASTREEDLVGRHADEYSTYEQLVDLRKFPALEETLSEFVTVLRAAHPHPKFRLVEFQQFLVRNRMVSIVRDLEVWKSQMGRLDSGDGLPLGLINLSGWEW